MISEVIVILIPDLYQGDFVLCVKEGKRVSHYIINREEQGYRIGEKLFTEHQQRGARIQK